MKHAYHVTFRLLSDPIHSGWSKSASSLRQETAGSFSLLMGPGPDGVELPLAAVFDYFLRVAKGAFQAFGIADDYLRKLELDFGAEMARNTQA